MEEDEPEHETALVGEIEAERQAALKDIHDAYDPVLEPLPELREELSRLEAADFAKWSEAPDESAPHFGPLKALVDEIQAFGVPALAGSAPPSTLRGGHRTDTLKRGHQTLGIHPSGCSGRTLKEAKAELRTKAKEVKEGIKERLREVKGAVKELGKLDEERTERLAEINAHADRHVAQVKEAAADLSRICADPENAKRHFTVVERPEFEENEFNLNLPRYVDTFEPEERIPLDSAMSELRGAEKKAEAAKSKLDKLLSKSLTT